MTLTLVALLTMLAAPGSALAQETCVAVGRETELMKGVSPKSYFSMAPDGKMGFLYDPETKKGTAIFFPSLRRQEVEVKKGSPMPLVGGRIAVVDLSNVIYNSGGAPTVDEKKSFSKVIDLAKGTTKEYPGVYYYLDKHGSEKPLAVKSVNQQSEVLAQLAKKLSPTQSAYQTWGMRMDFPFEGLPATFVKQNEIRILPFGAKEFQLINVALPRGMNFLYGGLSQDGKTVFGSICEKMCEAMVTIDIATGSTRTLPIPNDQRWYSLNERGTFTPEGTFIPANASFAIDLSAQRLIPMEGYPSSAYGRMINGKYCVESGTASAEEMTSTVCFDTATGKKTDEASFARYASPSMYYNGNAYAADGSIVARAGDKLIAIQNNRACSNPKAPALDPECENLTPALVSPDFLGSLGAALRCETEYQPAGFPQELEETQFSELEALRWLEKLSKPGAFSSAADLRALRTIVNRGWEKKYPNETKGALAGILATSPSAYAQLLNENLELATLKGSPTFSCLTPLEKEKVTSAARTFLEQTQKGSMRAVVDLARSAGRLADGILDDDARYKMADDLATVGLERLTRFGQQPNIFPYKLHVILNNTARRELGLPVENVTDISIIKKEGEILPVLMAATTENGMQLDPMLGVATQPLPPIKIAELPLGATEKDIRWTYEGKDYEAKVTLTRPRDERKVISEAKAPDFKSMWKDGELRGLVVVGSNMEGDLTDKTVQAYLSYYMKSGFKFGKPGEVKDVKSLMKERISGANGADYFIKEAHSDGDQQNLFEIPKSARSLKGERTVNGKKETLEILFPASEGAAAEKLSNADFGDWIKAREKSGGGQFLYLNSSCWSAQKAPFEVAAAYSPTLLNIASTGMVDTFEDKPTNVMRIMVDSIRKGQDYDRMRKNLEKDPEYKAKTANTFVFPDSDEYKTHITQKMALPVTIDSQLVRVGKDGTKTPYSAEQ